MCRRCRDGARARVRVRVRVRARVRVRVRVHVHVRVCDPVTAAVMISAKTGTSS